MVQLPLRYSRPCEDEVAAAAAGEEEVGWWGLRDVVVAAVGGGSDMALASLRKRRDCVTNEVILERTGCLENGFTIPSLFSFFSLLKKNKINN